VSDLGVNGIGVAAYALPLFTADRQVSRVHVGTAEMMLGFYGANPQDPFQQWTGRDTSIGNPAAPSQRQGAPGILTDIWWPVQAGSRSLSIDVRQTKDPGASLRPRLVVKGDATLGVPDDVIVTMDGTVGSWKTLTAVLIVLADGVLWVWRERRDWDLSQQVHWDNLRTT